MTAPSLLDELASEEKWLRQAAGEIASEGHNGWGNTCSQAADCIKRTHATIAGMAKRLEAAERDSRRLDWLEGQREAYGFEDCHEGNRWVIDGPFATARAAIDAAQEGEG